MKTSLITLLIGFCFYTSFVFAQVGEITNEIKKEKEKEKASSSNNSGNTNNNSNEDNSYYDNYSSSDDDYYDDGDDESSSGNGVGAQIIGSIFSGLGNAIGEEQRKLILNKDKFPEIVSLETSFSAGIYLNQNGNIYYPRIQGNYGLVSSEFRYTVINDLSGRLSTLDWQILKFNIPVNPVRVSAGLGFINLPTIHSTYIESSVRTDVWLWKRKVSTFVEFRSSGKINSKRLRQEFNFQVDYKIKSFGKLHISPMIGIKQQSYLEKYEQTYLMAGINFRIQ